MKTPTVASLTTMQFIFLISGFQISVSFLALPRQLSNAAGTDGWAAILIDWAVSTLVSLVIVKIMQKSPEGTVLDLLSRRIGKWAGNLAAVVFGLYFLSLAYDGLVRSVLVTKVWLLTETPVYIILALFLLPVYTIGKGGPVILGRYSEFVLLVTFWMLFIYLAPLKEAHWLHLLPFPKSGLMPIFYAVKNIIFSFLGFAIVLFLYPNLKHKQYAVRGVVISNAVTAFVYLWVTLICFIYFSPDEIQEINQPIITMLKTVEFRFIERIEIPFISLYLFSYSLLWIPAAYLTVYCSSWLLESDNAARHLQIVCTLLVVVSYFYFPSFNHSEKFEASVGAVGGIVEYVFPACLLPMLALREKVKRKGSLQG